MGPAGIVFLADDEDAHRESLRELLEDEGYYVLQARDGRETLARMEGVWRSSVAIVDLMMPGMDGFGLIAAMQAHPELRRIPIIVLSSNRVTEPIPGAARVLRKPCRPEALFGHVRELLAREAS